MPKTMLDAFDDLHAATRAFVDAVIDTLHLDDLLRWLTHLLRRFQ